MSNAHHRHVHRHVLLALTLGLAFAAAPAVAEEAKPAPAGVDTAGRQQMREQMRARIQEKMQTYLTVELANRAGLDAAKSLKLSELIKAHLDKKRAHREKMRDAAQRLRSTVDQKAPDAQVKQALDALWAERRNDVDADALLANAKFLTPTEQAKVALALPEVLKDMRGMMKQSRQQLRQEMRGQLRERLQEREERMRRKDK